MPFTADFDSLHVFDEREHADLVCVRKAASRKSGFSLIELLVVIAIIAILAVRLLPALTKAKQRAQNTRGLSQLHQCYVAMQAYLSDSDEKMFWGDPRSPQVAIDGMEWFVGVAG